MIRNFGNKFSELSQRFVPDPFVLAILLTLFTAVVALVFGENFDGQSLGESSVKLGGGWWKDFTSAGLLKFAFQMCVVLFTGHAIASSKPVRAVISNVAKLATSPAAAAALVAFVACIASLIQWGLGAIVGAFIAREVGRAFAEQGRAVHYPVLGAAGYAGFLVWHGGLSGSAPLKVAEPNHFLVEKIGVISIDQTVFGTLNIAVTVTMLIVIPALFWFLMPKEESEMSGFHGSLEDEQQTTDQDTSGFVGFLENRYFLNGAIAAAMLGYIGFLFVDRGVKAWNLDTINLLFLTLSIALHKSPRAYIDHVTSAVKGCAGILLQFPFYFGILGMLKASGLIHQISNGFVSIASKDTLEIVTFISAGVVNFFVPSGGGQWAVQGPIMMDAAHRLGAEPGNVIMALAYGDAWTNMLQPFWALPLLGIMGLQARQIVGYTTIVLLVTGPIFIGLLLLF